MGDRLKELRRARALTQQELADVLGLDRTTYAKYEAGANEPNIATIRALAAFFGVTTDYLLGNSDSPAGSIVLEGFHIDSDPPLEDMTEGEREELADFARYLLSKRRRQVDDAHKRDNSSH